MDLSTIDYAPLTHRPDRVELARVRQEALEGAFGSTTARSVKTNTRDGLVLLAVLGGFITAIFAVTTVIRAAQGAPDDDTRIGVFFTLGVAVLCVIIYLLSHFAGGSRRWRRMVQLIEFARANGFTVQPESDPVILPGLLARHQSKYHSTHERVEWTQDGLSAECALHTDASYGRTVSTFSQRYLAVRLPHDFARVSFLGGLRVPVQPDRYLGENVLDGSVAGRHPRARLICRPADRDTARALFTEELIDILTDPRHPANAEVVEGWFLAYYRTGDRLDPELWRRTLEAADAIARNATAWAPAQA
jgi:hypothetical protein